MRHEKVSLVTGGAGFIGSHVVDECLVLGHKVVVLDDLSGGARSNVSHQADLVVGSVTDAELVDHVFETYQPNYVYHLAAYAAEGLSHFIRHFNYTNNVLGSANVINAAVKSGWVERFVFASSAAVYGYKAVDASEEHRPLPADPYGIAKYAVELDLAAAHDLFGLPYTVFRMHNVYGERQNTGDPYRNVIGIFIRQMMDGEPLSIFGDGMQTRQWTPIDSIDRLIASSVMLPEMANETYNLGTDEVHTVMEAAFMVVRAFDTANKIQFLPARSEARFMRLDHAKIQRLHIVGEGLSLEDGIARMVAWVKEHGVRRSKPFERIEITRNLPPSWIGDRIEVKYGR